MEPSKRYFGNLLNKRGEITVIAELDKSDSIIVIETLQK